MVYSISFIMCYTIRYPGIQQGFSQSKDLRVCVAR